LAANGASVITSHGQQQVAASASGQTFPYEATVPLKGLAGGRYLLRVEARSRLSNGPTVFHEIPFIVQ
jgi:hypothetical protein